MTEIQIAEIKTEKDTIILYYHGEDDYSYYSKSYDCSTRGTYEEIMTELKGVFTASI